MIELDGNSLSLELFRRIVCEGEKVGVSDKTRETLKRSRKRVEDVLDSGQKVYSVNTGLGIFSRVTIEKSQITELQENFIRSHCAGVGEPHSELESRAILLLRANVLAKGYSGVRPELMELLVGMLNHGVHPVIPEKGSVGASGDLAPLAHLASVVIGEGEAFVDGERMPGGVALAKFNLKPMQLGAKEGLSLINGTQQMTGVGALLLLKAEELLAIADLICATSLEGVLGSTAPFAAWIHESRPFTGQVEVAARLRRFMQNSEIVKSHVDCDRVQDPYSFRCTPQVHGAVSDLFDHVRRTLAIELNAATDNPLIHPETGEVASQGNFHGQPVAFALDILAMGLSELASLSERRIAKLVDPSFSELPCHLTKEEGLNSGFMMHHVTAASLVSECRLLTHPGSTDSIPTNVEKEDHVSMGPLCARKARTILENLEYVLAIEALAACQALDFRLPMRPGDGPKFLYDAIRAKVAPLERDRYLGDDINWVKNAFHSGDLYRRAKGDDLI